MSLIRILLDYTFGPRLFKVYEVTTVGRLVDKSYEPKILERWGDRIIVSFTAVWSISSYALVLAATFMYCHSYSTMDIVYSLSKVAASTGIIFIASLAARGFSRANNPVYLKFIKTLRDAYINYNATTKQELSKYDFEFLAWPVDFDISTLKREKNRKKLRLDEEVSSDRLRIFYIVAYCFAIKLIYPGSVSVINWTLSTMLLKGRVDLIEQGGERYKLITCDRNMIDTIFIDQRNKTTNGDILVITCEGNCGFYETGIITTPLSKGYSVLGWNHPGFGGSTGAPDPVQEENAIDCIMQFAKHHLTFPESRIILYGWSIGGYTATWAAMNYPSIKSLVLDATFDDILPLAIMTMPSLEGLVRNVIRSYFNLNIAEQLNRYDGTMLLIRRTDDEIVCTPPNTLSGNRGNILLTKVLLRRYPYLFSKPAISNVLLTRFLSANISERRLLLDALEFNEKQCLKLIASEIKKNDGIISYPSTLGQDCDVNAKHCLAIFLATMYMKDQPSSHCTPLSVDLFQPGWDPATAISIE